MNSKPKIAAVFATMNRADTALSCVTALAAQTLAPDFVMVADNASSDETVSSLEARDNLPFALHVKRMDENVGNAGRRRCSYGSGILSGSGCRVDPR